MYTKKYTCRQFSIGVEALLIPGTLYNADKDKRLMIILFGYRFSWVVAATFIESIAGQTLNLDNNKNKLFPKDM